MVRHKTREDDAGRKSSQQTKLAGRIGDAAGMLTRRGSEQTSNEPPK
ncbi:hypothetical protein RMSM_02878 [Rhodopirellula maiorica SM1]|uniref:Uncharacterized protein n=1 Tax=Rhodopirellula maiorica SM1 TaxID=1265738 RepID=M5RLW6_9BACT|nr:hypothetical protein RMSM_02878 [Rhodopirellula maiorica SM1]